MAIKVWFLSGRRKLLSIDHSISIGLKSGEYLGKNITLASVYNLFPFMTVEIIHPHYFCGI